MEYEKLLEVGEKLGYKGGELKKFVNTEIEKQRSENEKQRSLEEKKLAQEKEMIAQEKEMIADQERLELAKQATLKLQLQIKNESQNNDNGVNNTGSASGNTHVVNKVIKIQPYNPKEEDIDKFLKVFEGIMKMNRVEESNWVIYLCQAMRGSARDALSYMDNMEGIGYSTIKTNLLRHFSKTEEFYRLKFHNMLMDDTCDPQVYIADLKCTLTTWIEMTGIDKANPSNIIELLLVDKVLDTATPELYSFIKERKIHNEKDLIKCISDFKDSHPQNKLNKKVINSNENSLFAIKTYNDKENDRNKTQIYSSLPSRRYNTNKRNYRKMVCWYCNKIGHLQHMCRNRQSENGNHQTFVKTTLTNGSSNHYNTPKSWQGQIANGKMQSNFHNVQYDDELPKKMSKS